MNFLSKEQVNDPHDKVTDREFRETIYKFGTYMCLVENRHISPTSMVIRLLEDQEWKNFLMEMVAGEMTWMDVVIRLQQEFPIIGRSKKILKRVRDLQRDGVL